MLRLEVGGVRGWKGAGVGEGMVGLNELIILAKVRVVDGALW